MIEYTKEKDLSGTDRFVCSFSGRLDTQSCAKIEVDLFGKISSEGLPVRFDMKDVDYVASAFLRICLRLAKEMGGDRYSISNVKPGVLKVFKIAGFDEFLNIS